jgi:hypothetical protein
VNWGAYAFELNEFVNINNPRIEEFEGTEVT